MSVKFKALARRNPSDLLAPPKFYAKAIGDGEVTLDDLSQMIADQNTVTEADCYAVLISLEKNIITTLGQGRIVKLGRLGSFQLSVNSEGFPTAEEVTSNAIIKTRVIFRPAKRMRDFFNNVVFKKEGTV